MAQTPLPPPIFARDLTGFGRSEPLRVSPETTIQKTAQLMEEGGWDSALIFKDDQLVGIVTDRDFRKKALARGLLPEEAVSKIMSGPIETLDISSSRTEGLLQMIQKKRHHLVIVDQGEVVAVARKEDFIAERTYSPLFFAGQIQEAGDAAELKRIFLKLPQAVRGLLAEGLSVERVSPLLSSINDWMIRRAAKLAEHQMATKAPAPFAVMVLGSEGRGEQTFKTDQDNALIHGPLDDEESGKVWFMEYAQRLCSMLDHIGYPYCPGEIMAQNPRWNRSLESWKELFGTWVTRPAAEEILRANIFFDFRGVYGALDLVEALEDHLFKILPKSGPFPANLAQAAVQGKPPLGLFGRFKTQGDGEHAGAFDIKEKGAAISTDLARAHSLIEGVRAKGTLNRLMALEKVTSKSHFAELYEAHEYLSDLRLRHQLDQLENDQAPDNWIDPESLTEIEQRHLKLVFKTLAQAQEALLSKYAGGVR